MERTSTTPHDEINVAANGLLDVDGLPASHSGPPGIERIQRGHVMLDARELRQLRQARLMSQQDLADECWRRCIQISLTTIKRAEAGRPVRFRIAREFAKCFEVSVIRILGDVRAIAKSASTWNDPERTQSQRSDLKSQA